MLNTRKYQVWFYTKPNTIESHSNDWADTEVKVTSTELSPAERESNTEIEPKIVRELIKQHDSWLSRAA